MLGLPADWAAMATDVCRRRSGAVRPGRFTSEEGRMNRATSPGRVRQYNFAQANDCAALAEAGIGDLGRDGAGAGCVISAASGRVRTLVRADGQNGRGC